jgi:hypothetical protein
VSFICLIVVMQSKYLFVLTSDPYNSTIQVETTATLEPKWGHPTWKRTKQARQCPRTLMF